MKIEELVGNGVYLPRLNYQTLNLTWLPHSFPLLIRLFLAGVRDVSFRELRYL